ncbi:MAG TPA: hypothetical protein VE987_17460 [Polyangiaceae bacterium]|nr:hypothetical protein [Polyangiaceae bacterium]
MIASDPLTRAGASRAATRARRLLAIAGPWIAYVAAAVACTHYLNRRTDFIPKWGHWYMADPHPYVLLQVRAFLSGKLALFDHPSGAGHDYVWGRGGMQQAWGLGLPLLATPLHLVGRLFGAPGFPDHVRFLLFHAAAGVLLARALHQVSPREPTRLAAGVTTAGFVMVFPTFVGLVAARFQIYEQTIATGAVWTVVLLAGVLALLHRCTPWRLAAVCAAAGFAPMIRAPLASYGVTTVVLALIIADRKGLRPRALAGGACAAAAMGALYLIGNTLRFGSPLDFGYTNGLDGPFVNRLLRWGLPFAKVPFAAAATELFVMLFRLDPVPGQIMTPMPPPPSIAPYALSERWREYYSQTYDKFVFACFVATVAIVCWRVLRGRLWRRDRPLDGELPAVLGAWALPPAIGLFYFYARAGNIVTRYLVDFYPAFAACMMCAATAAVAVVRKRAPAATASVQLVIAGAGALYLAAASGRNWPTHLSEPVDASVIRARMALIDGLSDAMPQVPDHFQCNDRRGPPPVHMHLDGWMPDCTFASGMVFAMPHSRCVRFTLRPNGASWTDADEKALAGFRATADSDSMVRCDAAPLEGGARRLTMCDPRPPHYLLDGLRLYSIASLDEQLEPMDRLRLERIEGAPACR